VVTDPYGKIVEAVAWPPRNAVLCSVPDLPGPAYVLARVGWRQVMSVGIISPLLYLSMLRMVGPSVPPSRLGSPGARTVLVVLEVVPVAVSLARRGRATEVGTHDWVAVRGLFGRRWRQQSFAEVERFSSRTRQGRSSVAVVTVADGHGRRLSLTLGYHDPALPALLARLRATGAREVDRRELAPVSRRRAGTVLVGVLAAICLPIGYLLLGPLRLLPPSIAGAFTWSGCRASLAAEGKSPERGAPYLAATIQTTGATWRLLTTRRVNASTFVQHTGDPAARLAHLQRDGFRVADRAYVQNAAGAVVDVQMLRFATAQGAEAYDTYVNRAVCEQDWKGRSGPRPTEVHLQRGKAALVRWVGGDSLIEVSQTSSTPFSTPQQVDAIAAALIEGPTAEPSGDAPRAVSTMPS
jgi:hypothetical protein